MSNLFTKKQFVISLALPVSFFLLTFFFNPFREAFLMDTDEGGNMMVAALMVDGYELYTDIWADQPPLFHYLTAGVFSVTGVRVNVGRLVVLLFSTSLIWSLAAFVQVQWGWFHGVAAGLMLWLSTSFTQFSTAMMIGMPGLALAMLSLFILLLWHKTRKPGWVFLAGAIFGASLMMKLVTGFLLPVFMAGIWLAQTQGFTINKAPRQWIMPLVWFGGGIAAFVLPTILFLIPFEHLSILYSSHVPAITSDVFINMPRFSINNWLLEIRMILYLALAGTVYVLHKKERFSIYLAAWFLVGYLVLSQYRPVWNHYQLLLAVPAAGLAGIAIGEAAAALWSAWKHRGVNRTIFQLALLPAIVILLFSGYVGYRHGAHVVSMYNRPTPALRSLGLDPASTNMQLVSLIRSSAGGAEVMATDMQMYAVLAGIPTYPDMAYISWKATVTGQYTEEKFLGAIIEREPPVVLVARFDWPSVRAYLLDNYDVRFQQDHIMLAVRR